MGVNQERLKLRAAIAELLVKLTVLTAETLSYFAVKTA